MDRQKPLSSKQTMGFGALFAAVGLYFILVGLGLVPVPGGSKALHAPLWIVACAGLAFFLGGAAVFMPATVGEPSPNGEMPKNAPRWMYFTQYLFGLAIFVCFALIGTWIAIGPGPRTFTGTVPVGELGGRIAFGIGAVIVWLATIAVAVSGARKFLRRDRS
ncbi:MAG TPA: hypothetical protein VIG34_05220 [Xanthobacteraceae bacterium]|jgi:hypothetical protein